MRFLIALVLFAVTFAADVPSQVHIALAGKASNGDSNTMAISWHTQGATATSTVNYGTASGVYTESATGSGSSYYETYNHHTVLGQLSPNTKYYYKVGDDAAGWSSELSFVSAPTSDSLRGNFSFFVFGDLGEVNGQATETYIKTNKDSVNLIWHAGDESYADDSFLHFGCALKFCYESAFDKYMDDIQEWASSKPYMVSPGNHEADCHDPACLMDSERREKLSNFTAYNHRFRMPSPETGGVQNMWYSFNYGNVHFISMDTETDYTNAPLETRYILPCGGFGNQMAWLEQDLIAANANRAQRPWILVDGHRPMYSGDTINAELQAAVEEMFYKYGVDVYFTGHEHSYARNYPVYKGVPETTYTNPAATTHLLIGGAGNDEMRDAQVSTSVAAPVKAATGAWTVVTDDYFGIGKVTIVDDSNLHFEYIRTSTGEVFDSFNLYRDHSRYGNKKMLRGSK